MKQQEWWGSIVFFFYFNDWKYFEGKLLLCVNLEVK